MIEAKHYTWEEKIDNLVKLAKSTGTFLHLLDDRDYDSHTYRKMRQNILEAYDEFCDWRHDEPYVVDEIKALIQADGYTDDHTTTMEVTDDFRSGSGSWHRDEVTGTQMWVTYYADESEHPMIQVKFPRDRTLSLEQMNEVMDRLQNRAGIPPEQRMKPLKIMLPE